MQEGHAHPAACLVLPIPAETLLTATPPPTDETVLVKAGVKADADPAEATRRAEELTRIVVSSGWCTREKY